MNNHQHSIMFGYEPTTDIYQPVSITDEGEIMISTSKLPDNNDKVKLTSADGIALYADTLPAPQSDTNERTGWLWEKVVADATKLNYYMYGSVGSSHQYTLADFKGAFGTLSVDNWQNSSSVPFIIVYTKLTGTGDAGTFYHSKRVYTAPASNRYVIGEQLNLYAGTKPDFNNNNRSIELSTVGMVWYGRCL